MLQAASRADEAVTWLRSRAEAGDISALKEAAGMLQAASRADEAVAVYLQVAEAGDIRWAAGMLRAAGRADEAARLRRYGVEPGGRMADPWEASDRA
jgi:hypothetical protein